MLVDGIWEPSPSQLDQVCHPTLGVSTSKADAASLPEQGSIQTTGSEGIDDDAGYPHGSLTVSQTLDGKVVGRGECVLHVEKRGQ